MQNSTYKVTKELQIPMPIESSPLSILFWRFFLRLFSLVIAFVAVYNVVSCDYALGCDDDAGGDQGS